jgi:2-polyprenyl-3-methyl-5-hydroxy-6-metoxy-1,4-benzoquinol methylase
VYPWALTPEVAHIVGAVDVLYLYETLEHQPCPEEFLLLCADMLAPGGVLVVVVPNDYNPLQLQAQQQLGIPRWWLAPPQHLHYFTPKTLQLLVRRCGFRIADMRGTYPLEQHLLTGENYIGNDMVGRKVHSARKAIELHAVGNAEDWDTLMAKYRGNLVDRIGREIVCIAQKG